MKNKTLIDEFHYHEAIDRTYVLMHNLDTFLISHPVIKKHKSIKRKLKKMQNNLYNIYQKLNGLSCKQF